MTYTLKEIIYSSGDVFLPQKLKDILGTKIYKYPNDNEKYIFYIQGWTFIHFLSGMFFGYIYMKLKYNIKKYYINLFFMHTLWEIWQIIIGMSKPWKITGMNNIIDTLVDTSVFMIGSFLIMKIMLH